MMAGFDFTSKSRKCASWPRIPSAFSAAISFVSNCLSEVLPEGSPINPVPPPTSAMEVWPCRCMCTRSMTTSRLPTWRLDAEGSKPIYPVRGAPAKCSAAPSVASCSNPLHRSSSINLLMRPKGSRGWRMVKCSEHVVFHHHPPLRMNNIKRRYAPLRSLEHLFRHPIGGSKEQILLPIARIKLNLSRNIQDEYSLQILEKSGHWSSQILYILVKYDRESCITVIISFYQLID